MTAQKGFQYEKNAAKFLQPLGIVPKSFNPAGASHDKPDLILLRNNVEAGCELKITDASAGSLVLKWNPTNKRSPWGFNDISKDDSEKLFIRDLAIKTGVLDQLNSKWKKVPAKFSDLAKSLTKEQMYRHDLATFRDIKTDISAKEIEKYYTEKNTHYINIGTHGFYLLGRNDKLKLNENISNFEKIPTFGSSAIAWSRARVQYKGSNNYQFTFELQFRVQTKSPYNIAPITKDSVIINKKNATTHIFL